MVVVEEAAEPTRPATRAGLRYRPYLDGLRCVAVYLVVAFHSGLHRFSGGFIGVDIFFVLSGYLMTRILVRELVQRDRISFRHFYARRFRRILPAAAVTLLGSAFVYGIVASPFEGAQAARRLPRRVPLLRQLALHLAGEQLLRPRGRREPGAALLVARDRGAVLLRVAAVAHRAVPRRAAGAALAVVGAARAHGVPRSSRRRRGRCTSRPRTSTVRTTAPTLACTSSSRAG